MYTPQVPGLALATGNQRREYGESRLSRELRSLRGVEFHVRTEPSLEGQRVSGTMSFQVGTQWFPGCLSAR